MDKTETNQVWQVSVDTSGRVLLPAELRNAMDVEPGSELLWVKDESGLRLKSFDDTLAEIQAYYKSLEPADVVWSEELIKDRRREASLE